MTNRDTVQCPASKGSRKKQGYESGSSIKEPKPLEKNSLSGVLKQEAQRLSKDGELWCEFELRGKVLKLPTEVEIELFRIFEEAMTNVRKHALARGAWITLEFKIRQIILTVRDNGIGIAATNFPERKRSYGLATMRERAARIGGQLDIAMPPNGGCAVRVALPLSKKRTRFFMLQSCMAPPTSARAASYLPTWRD
jgi:nitrate/nitrite-specific signal transduction histidine kinase